MPSEITRMNTQPIKIAILAMGGEGGNVLANWIVDLAEQNAYLAQTTSVPGVAQRTGATIYYLELFPQALVTDAQRPPVLALMPLPGDVDVVLASELMEAGRAVQRGLVTPDRTTLIASTHRVYAIAEKIALADGRVNSATLLDQTMQAAKHMVRFDMAKIAEDNNSVISAVLFGALCAAGVLPFNRAQFEATIARSSIGVEASLRAFSAAHVQATHSAESVQPLPTEKEGIPAARDPGVRRLLEQIQTEFPKTTHALLMEGLRRVIDYQDLAYATLYLQRITSLCAAVESPHGPLINSAARHLALWMSYEDTIRVADLKTRQTRFERVRQEVHLGETQQLAISEFMHPRMQELCESLPAPLGRWLLRPHFVHRTLNRFMQQGRVITTSSLRGFLLLWTLSRMRVWRRITLRFSLENERIEQWLACIRHTASLNPALALEVVHCQSLVKGYGDTHARGLDHFNTLMRIVKQQPQHLTPATLKELCDAALADEQGRQLEKALQRHALA